MTEQQKIAELEAKLATLQNQQREAEEKPSMYIKLGNKRNVVVGGKALKQRFPVTLYAPSWLALLEQADEIKKFIEDNHDALSWER
jgi:hypothetical protein